MSVSGQRNAGLTADRRKSYARSIHDTKQRPPGFGRHSTPPHGSARTNGSRGQGSTEYILIIGLIVLAIITGLFVFRNSTVGFIDKVADWLNGYGDQSASESPAAPAGDPAPPPKPPDPLDPLAGTWCWNWVAPDGTETPDPQRVEVTRAPDGSMVWNYGASHDPLEPTGDGTFRMKDHPEITFHTNPDGSIAPSDRNNVVMRRCG